MPRKGLTVFDLDGTIIRVNSFREITRRFALYLLIHGRVRALFRVGRLYAMRRLGILSHLAFKERIVDVFERSLAEPQKEHLCESTFSRYVNRPVRDKMSGSTDCIVSTAAPFAYVSRMSFAKQVPVISALDPSGTLPEKDNFGSGKIANLKAYLDGNDLSIETFFTDSLVDDQPLVDLANHVLLVDRGRIRQFK
jgi:hypothetical protein